MKIYAITAGAALAVALVVAPAASAAVKAGAACKKAGQVSIVSGMKFTCVKKGGKLVWGKGVAVKSKPAPAANPEPSNSAAPAEPVAAGYTMDKVKANNKASSCWTAISGNVYDLTQWINQHPGGSSAIISLCGTEGTSAFRAMHGNQRKPESRLAGYLLGPLAK